MSPSRLRVFRFWLVLVGMVIGWGIIEAASWCLLRCRPASAPMSRWEFRSSRPAPYRDAPWFGPAFLTESMRCVRLGQSSGGRYFLPGDFQGRFIHIQEGRRRTTDQPEVFDHRLLLFGGSAVFGLEVPDAHTLASCLQRALNATPGPRFRVENLGVPAMIADQQTDRLLTTELKPDDVVLFYDGVNDVFYPIYQGNPTGYHPGTSSDSGVRQLTGLQVWLYPLCFRLKRYSCAAALMFHGMDNPRPAQRREATLSRHLDTAQAGYLRALTQAQEHTRKQGARFLHALQPNLFTLRQPGAYERRLLRRELKVLPGLDQAYRLGYPRMRQAIAAAELAGIQTFDLSEVLDSRAEGEEFYLDFCHVNHTANERLARALCAGLRSALSR